MGLGASVNGKEFFPPSGFEPTIFGNLIRKTLLTKTTVNIYIGYGRFPPLDSPKQLLTFAVHSAYFSGFMIDTFFPYTLLV